MTSDTTTSGAALYARRLAVLPRLLAILELHPDGLPLAELAAEVGTDTEALREVLLAYYCADLVDVGDFDPPVIEFFNPGTGEPAEGSDHDESADEGGDEGGDEDADDPATAEWVRVLSSNPAQELGVDNLTAEQLGQLHRAATDLLALEPDNEVLRSALEVFNRALWPELAAEAGGDPREPVARDLYRAARERRRVRIEYVRQWRPGGGERVIEPYRLVHTRRGWEVDAGPADAVAAVRTFLVSGIRRHEVLEERFDLPEGLDAVLAAQRTPAEVHLVVPQDRRWVVERYAEKVTVLDDDEEMVSLVADLLPPVGERLGLLLLVCGPDAFVMTPEQLRGTGREVAQRLLDHHAPR